MNGPEVKKVIAKHLTQQAEQEPSAEEVTECADALESLVSLLIEADKESKANATNSNDRYDSSDPQ